MAEITGHFPLFQRRAAIGNWMRFLTKIKNREIEVLAIKACFERDFEVRKVSKSKQERVGDEISDVERSMSGVRDTRANFYLGR